MRDVCRSFEEAEIEVLVEKSRRAVRENGVSSFLLVGGVASNRLRREKMGQMAKDSGIRLFIPRPLLCTDNGAMTARTALFRFLTSGPSGDRLNAVANAGLPGS